MNQPKTKGHGYFRKSKAYGLIPILALGTLATMGSTVSADETVSTTPSVTMGTTLDPQPAPSKDNTGLAQEAGHQTGELISAIPSPELDQATSTATDAGVVVTKEETVTHDSLAKAQADLDKQTQALKETTKTQQDLDTAQAKAKAAAQKAGVTLTPGQGSYYQELSKAKSDMATQLALLETVTKAQTKATTSLKAAMATAQAAGLVVTLGETTSYQTALDALGALQKQLGQLEKVKQTQQELDQLLDEAITKVKAQGLVIVPQDKVTMQDMAMALDKVTAQVSSLATLAAQKTELMAQLESARKQAQAAGVTITEGELMTYTDSDQASLEVAKQVETVTDMIHQKEALEQAYDQAQKASDETLSTAKTKAEQAGLIVTAGQAMTVTSPEAAQAETQKQVEVVTKTLETKERLDQLLAEAKKSAQGLSLTTGATKTYTDLAAALADAKAQQEAVLVAQKSQQASVTAVTQKQEQFNRELDQAKAQAQEAGVALTESESKQYETVAEAQVDLDKQVESLTKAQNTQQAANYLLEVAEAKAKQAGTPVVSKGTLTLTAEVAKAKASELSSVIEAVTKANEAIIKANETGKATETSNKAEVDRYNETTKAENRRVMEAAGLVYTGNYQKDLATVEEYNKTGRKTTTTHTEVIGDPTAFDKANAAASTTLSAGSNGFTPTGSSTFVKSQSLGGIELVASGSLEPNKNTVYIKGDIDESHIIDKIVWGNIAPEGGFLRQGTYGNPGYYWTGAYNYNPDGTTTQLWTVKKGDWYKLPKAITMMDGSVHDAYVQFDLDTNGLYHESAETFTDGNYAVMWNQNGAINAMNGFAQAIDNGGSGIRTTIKVDSPDNATNYLWLSLMSDFDGGQLLDKLDEDSKILGVGGGFMTNSLSTGRLASDEQLGYTWGKNKGSNALNGFTSSPDGTALIAQYGKQYSTVLRNTPGGNSNAVIRADFGSDAGVSKSVIKTKEVIEEKPEIAIKPLKNYDHKPFTPTPLKEAEVYRIQVEAATHPIVLAKAEPQTVELHEIKLSLPVSPVTLVNEKTYRVTLNPLTFTTAVQGVTLATTVNPIELTAEAHDVRLETAVHPVQVIQKPINVKHVINSDTVDINGQTIPKGSTVTWTLTNNPLEAGRDNVTAYTLKDALPAGFELDLKASVKASPDWLFTQEESGKLTITASQALLTKLNANRDQAVALPMVSLVGRVLHDNGSYQNTFKTLITTPSGSYTVVSNTPKITTPTPPRPVKSITDQAGANLNGASTFDKHVTFHLMTDYSPYSLVTASQDMISKGFVILDDVEDGAYTIDEAKIAITASDKTDVKDLFTMYHVLSNEARTEAIQAILDQAGLSPVGEFYLWVAKDPASFYTHYVKQAKNMTIDLPARLLVTAGEVVTNDFFQGDFGNTYQSNLVTVQVPDVNPAKHALDKVNDTKILDGQEVNIGEYIRYFLDGVTVPVKHDTLWQYEGKDKLDTTHDRYTGNWKGVIKGTEYTAKSDMILAYDVTTKDGQLIKAGETIPVGSTYAFTFTFDQDTNSDFIKQMVTVTWDKEKGEWSYQIDKAFLNSLGVEGTFDADFYLEVERIASGKVENTFVNIVNGKEMSAKVTTHTPEPPQPVTPKGPALPSTGEQGVSVLTVLGTALLSFLGLVGLKKRQQ